jgi:microcompartment protein CcmK/EutM
MRLARVIGNLVTSDKHPAYAGRKLMLVQPLGLDAEPQGGATMALDYVGAGPGDTVLVGAAPGLAAVVFHLEVAPINDLIMGIVDCVATQPQGSSDGNFGVTAPGREAGRGDVNSS